MWTFYSVIVLEVIILMIYLMIMANANDLLSREKRSMFLLLFFSIILSVAAEWTGSATIPFGGQFRQVHVWTKVVELSLTPLVPYLCAEVLSDSADRTKRKRWPYGVLLVHTVLEILSAFTGFIFYVDQKDIFCHGPFYWIYLLTYLVASAYVLRSGYQISRRYQNRNRIILPLLLGLLLFGVAANQLDKSVKVAWLTVAIVVTLFYLFYNDMMQRMDEMTMLLNRASYNNQLSRLHEPVLIQLFDVDFFKSVNDRYGHLYGDSCLRVIGSAIREIYGPYGKCYRIGGDEFCVILDSADSPLEQLNETFSAALASYRGTDGRFPYISVGYTKWDASCGDVEDAIQIADSMMYRNKDRNKIKHGPLTDPAAEEEALSSELVLAADQQGASLQLDISGLTSRTFTAFSGTTRRSYLYLCNMNTGVSRWSPAAVRYFGLPGEYMFGAGKIWENCIHPQDRKMYHEDIEKVFSGQSLVHELEYRVRNHLGEYVVCTCRGVVLKGDESAPDLFAGTIINHGIVDEVDPVTNLHTNGEFTKSIHRLLAERTAACLFHVGIEHFRHINAMYGQEGGNQVLRLFAMELSELLGGRGRVFRLEGAKFALYLYHAGRKEAQDFFHQVRVMAENNIQINNLHIPLRIYGGAVLLDGRHGYSDYIVRGSLSCAMEQSLEVSRGELVFDEAAGQAVNMENIRLHKEIHRSAVEGCRNFFLCYQPILSFATGKVIGTEALLRWKQEAYGVVPPDRFIPWLENDPSFIQVGNWILRRAIEETRPLWQADPDFVLNVNLAHTQLAHWGFRDDVLRILDETGCPARNLCLELTERCRHMDLQYLAEELRFFRSHGIAVAIDDFGTGSSSLTLPLQLPVSELKVDRLFVSKLFADEKYRYMMEGILHTARRGGFCTCIEGIETKEQYDLIASLGGDCYQGYYASRPVEIEAFLAFCRKNSKA